MGTEPPPDFPIPHGRAVGSPSGVATTSEGTTEETTASGKKGAISEAGQKMMYTSEIGGYKHEIFDPTKIFMLGEKPVKKDKGLIGFVKELGAGQPIPKPETPPEIRETLKDVYKSQLVIIYQELKGYEQALGEFGGQLNPEQKAFIKLLEQLDKVDVDKAAGKLLETSQGWLIAQTMIEKEMFLRLTALGTELELFLRQYSQEPFPTEERIREMEGKITKLQEHIKNIPHFKKIIGAAAAGGLLGGALTSPILGSVLGISAVIGGVEGWRRLKGGLRQGKIKFSDLLTDTNKLPETTQGYLKYLNNKRSQIGLADSIKDSAKAQLVFLDALGFPPQDIGELYAWNSFAQETSAGLPEGQRFETKWTRIRRGYLERLCSGEEFKKLVNNRQETIEEVTKAEFAASLARTSAELKKSLIDGSDQLVAENERKLWVALEGWLRISEDDVIDGFKQQAQEEVKEQGFEFGSKEERDFIVQKTQELIDTEVKIRFDSAKRRINDHRLEGLNADVYKAEEEAAGLKTKVEDLTAQIRTEKTSIFYQAQQETVGFFLSQQSEAISRQEPGALSSSITQMQTEVQRRKDPQVLAEQKIKTQIQLQETTQERQTKRTRLSQVKLELINWTSNRKIYEKRKNTENVGRTKADEEMIELIEEEKDFKKELETLRQTSRTRLLPEQVSRLVQLESLLESTEKGSFKQRRAEIQDRINKFAEAVRLFEEAETKEGQLSGESSSLNSEITNLERKIKTLEGEGRREILLGEEGNVELLQAALVSLRRAGGVLNKEVPTVLGDKNAIVKLFDGESEEREGPFGEKGKARGYLEFLKIMFDYEHPAESPKEDSQEKQMQPTELFAAACKLLTEDELAKILAESIGSDKTKLAEVFDELKTKATRPLLGQAFLAIISHIEHKGLRIGKTKPKETKPKTKPIQRKPNQKTEPIMEEEGDFDSA